MWVPFLQPTGARLAAAPALVRRGCVVALALASLGASPSRALARPTLNPSTHEAHGPITVPVATRRVARALQAPQASVHRRPPPREYASEALQDLQKLTADLDARRDPNTTPIPAPKGLKLPDLAIRWNQKSADYVQHYTTTDRGRTRMSEWMQRLVQYGPSLRNILQDQGVPQDLIYVAMVESGLHGGRRSRVGASGTWQFMPATGESYGLHQSRWVDDRNHVIKSTHAAALYLADLHARFGNWELALAAYNAGYGLLLKAMKRHNTNNYWALRNIESGLPMSTANYTPKVLALAVIGKNAKALGLMPKDTKSWDLIEIPAPPRVRLDDLAKLAGVDAEKLRELNSHLIRGICPPKSEPTTLVIPRSWKAAIDGAVRQKHAFAPIHLHRLRSGERVSDVAELAGVTTHDLLELNHMHSATQFRSGDELVVPAPINLSHYPSLPSHAVAVAPMSPRPDHTTIMVRVHPNTGARELERTFHARWKDIVRDNDLDPSARFFDGQTLLIQVPRAKLPSRDRALYILAKHTPSGLLLRGSKSYIESELRSRGLVRRAYRARRGETFEDIAARYASSAGSLGRINNMHPQARLREGQQIIVYTPAGHTFGTYAPPPPRREKLAR